MIDCLKRWWDQGDNEILSMSKAGSFADRHGLVRPTGYLHAPGRHVPGERSAPGCVLDVRSRWTRIIKWWIALARFAEGDACRKISGGTTTISLLACSIGTPTSILSSSIITRRLKPAGDLKAAQEAGYNEQWIVYGAEWFSAKELTVQPGRTVTIRDAGAYGAITMQGYGRFGAHPISAPSLIRIGQMTEDEFFVTYEAAQRGVTITNLSSSEPLVILKHFNPGNPEMPKMV
ncbi:MAG: hypothetical protein U0528_18105 [Anaerolineae bacterium]